jgi:hypothetical protein
MLKLYNRLACFTEWFRRISFELEQGIEQATGFDTQRTLLNHRRRTLALAGFN